jgi:hypothetical protein
MLLHNIRNQLYSDSASHLKNRILIYNLITFSRTPENHHINSHRIMAITQKKVHNLSHSGHVYLFMQSNRVQEVLTLKLYNVTRK